MRGAWAFGVAAVLWAAAPGLAWSGAWTQDQGQGVAILGATTTSSDRSLASDGHVSDTSSFTKTEIDFYAEYGIRDWLTAIVQGGVTSRRVGQPDASSFEGLDITEVGGRVRLWQHGQAVFSFQATQEIPGNGHGRDRAQYGNTDPATDLRVLGGYSFKIGSMDSFVDAEAGYRLRSGRPPSEYRFDATFGVRVRPQFLLLLQSFNTVSDGAGGYGFPRTRYSKLEASVVYDLNKSWSVQLGVIGTVAGQNALRERGLVGAVWRRF